MPRRPAPQIPEPTEYVKIGGQSFGIIRAPLIVEDVDGVLLGECRSHENLIYINNTVPESVQRSSLLHECIHGVSDAFGLDLSEQQVQSLESALFDMGVRIKTRKKKNVKKA